MVTRTVRELCESEELHRVTLSNISDAVFLTDDEGRFSFVCPNVDVIFGYSWDEVQALGGINALLGDVPLDRAELAARGEIQNIERAVTVKSGDRRVLLVHVKAVSIKGATLLFSCRDVTELRRAEEELSCARTDLAHASRLALVGELMASIAHEVIQPLTAIIADADVALALLEQDLGRDGIRRLREIVRDILEDGRLAAGVAVRLRGLACKRPLVLQSLDVNDTASDALRLVRRDAERRCVSIKAELEPSLPPVLADRICLQQVLLSLFLNSMDAMDGIDIASRRLLLKTRRIADTVELAVSDTGRGIAADYLPKLFTPFFTTKKDGVGLGLAVARSIVEAHRGRIWAEDHGHGATFRIALPSA